MCCQFSPDRVGRASYAVVGDEGKLKPACCGGRISFFDARQWELFQEGSPFTDADFLGCSPNTNAYWLSSIEKHLHAGVIEPGEQSGNTLGFL